MIGQPSIFNPADTRRRIRTPQHTFNVRHAPYEIQPFMIAPVLAGETMQSFSFQTRALTNPIKAPLIGWWLEHYWFYVKLSDIDYQDAWEMQAGSMRGMLVNDTAITLANDWQAAAAADRFYYWSPDGAGTMTGMNFVKSCLRCVVEAWFRDQDGAYNQFTIDGNPAAYLQNTTAFQSALLETAMDTATDVTIETTETGGPPITTVQVSARDVVDALRQYELLYEQGLINISYEDYLRQQGIPQPNEAEHIPELLRYSRDWQYPSSTVVPDTVTVGDSDVTSAVSWVVRSRADKKRFFKEPGFIFGVTLARPKVYLQAQKAPLVSIMYDAADWLPRVTMGSREGGWKQITDAATDILGGTATGNWWIDIRDLFLYGDQFVAGDTVDLSTATDINKMALPGTDLDDQGPPQASVDALFVSGDATGGVRQDGVTRLNISSYVREMSPRGAIVSQVR